MNYYTKYAEKKFDILREHQFTLTKEDVNDIIDKPEKLDKDKDYYFAQGQYEGDRGIEVVFKKEDDTKKVITFYPIKIR